MQWEVIAAALNVVDFETQNIVKIEDDCVIQQVKIVKKWWWKQVADVSTKNDELFMKQKHSNNKILLKQMLFPINNDSDE